MGHSSSVETVDLLVHCIHEEDGSSPRWPRFSCNVPGRGAGITIVGPTEVVLVLPLGEDSSGSPLSFVTPEVNKKIRQALLRQHWFSNRFFGSREAQYAESEFYAFVSRYELRTVRQRLLATAIGMHLTLIEPLLVMDDDVGAKISLCTVVPVTALALASGLCYARRTRPYWRVYVVATALGAYNSVLWGAILTTDMRGMTSHEQEYDACMQLVWLLIAMQLSSLGFALDFVHNLAVLVGQWSTFTIAMVWRWRRWRAEGQMELDGMPLHDVLQPGANLDALTFTFTPTHNLTSAQLQELRRQTGAWTLLLCALISALATLLLLTAVHRLNRVERQSFVNTFVLLNKTVVEHKRAHGQERALLALFSNPNAPQQLQLRPLQLGQELKFLLRSVPTSQLACEPAASLVDVEAAVKRCNPNLILFSGHSFAGSLAFEQPNGRIELPPVDDFIRHLEGAGRLRCVFLNGCNTSELGHQIVLRLPHVMAICWSSVAEDAAARSFALGFYDAVGAYLAAGEDLQVEIGFWAGLERFSADGFKLGDPAAFLHGAGHPHVLRPVFSPPCPGCTPPVHGMVHLLRAHRGEVERLHHDASGAKDGDSFSWGAVGIEQLRPGAFVYDRGHSTPSMRSAQNESTPVSRAGSFRSTDSADGGSPRDAQPTPVPASRQSSASRLEPLLEGGALEGRALEGGALDAGGVTAEEPTGAAALTTVEADHEGGTPPQTAMASAVVGRAMSRRRVLPASPDTDTLAQRSACTSAREGRARVGLAEPPAPEAHATMVASPPHVPPSPPPPPAAAPMRSRNAKILNRCTL